MDLQNITYNFNQICRFCLTQGGVMSAIFDEETQGNSVPLSIKIMACVSIQVSANDGLPSLICHRCLYQMERSYEFKVQCEYSDSKLRQYISQLKPQSDQLQSRRNSGTKQLQYFENRKLEQLVDVESVVVNVDPLQVEVEDRTVVLRNVVTTDQKPSVIEIKLPPSVDISPLGIKQENISGTEASYNDMDASLGHSKERRGFSARPHICSLCGKGFAQRRELNRHHLVHSGEKPYSCPICGKRFARRDKVVSHFKVHGRQNTYNCFRCPAMFKCRDELRHHEMRHAGKQPWCCKTCYKMFCSKAELVKHRKTHREMTSFTCNLCSVTFSQKEKLTKHMKIHSKSKFLCSSSFSVVTRSDRLTRHTASQLKESNVSNPSSVTNVVTSPEYQTCGSTNDRAQDDVDKSLSRLGQNPEILLFPIPQQ